MRFQIEFIFRDAKQFTGLTHCQARSDEKLDFHFNLSLAALNVVNVQKFDYKDLYENGSMAHCVTQQQLLKELICG